MFVKIDYVYDIVSNGEEPIFDERQAYVNIDNIVSINLSGVDRLGSKNGELAYDGELDELVCIDWIYIVTPKTTEKLLAQLK